MFAFQERPLGGLVERPARAQFGDPPQWQGVADRLDRAHQIGVLRRRGERRQLESADRQEHVARRGSERRRGIRHRRNLDPAITRLGEPGRPAQPEQRQAETRAGGGGVARHDRSKRVSGIDRRRNPLLGEPAGQAFDAAKAADAGRQRRRARVAGAPGQGQDRVDIGSPGERRRQCGGFGRAAENEDAHARVLADG